MFNIWDEINLLEKTLKAIKKFDLDDMNFNMKAALIRHFETIGGIAKQLSQNDIKTIKKDKIWLKAIRTRDKISHSYFSLDVSILQKALEDIGYLLSTINKIRKELEYL